MRLCDLPVSRLDEIIFFDSNKKIYCKGNEALQTPSENERGLPSCETSLTLKCFP